MNYSPATTTISSLESIVAQSSNSLLKVLIFKVKNLTLGLPVDQVKKVTKKNIVHGSGLSHVNLSHIGEQEVTVIDLHRKLFQVSASNVGQEKEYLIITKSLINEPLGIVVTETPILIDIPIAQIRTIPQAYRQADTLGIASHVAVIPQENEASKTIFILDLTQFYQEHFPVE